MKKRVIALFLIMTISLALVLPASAGDNGVFGSNGADSFAPDLDSFVDVTRRDDETGADLQHYLAFAFAANRTETLRWSEMDSKNLTADSKWLDIRRIARGTGILVLSSSKTPPLNTIAGIEALVDGEGSIDYAVIPISGIADRPAKPVFTFAGSDVHFNEFTPERALLPNPPAPTLEWTYINAWEGWRDVTFSGIRLSGTRSNIWVRTKGQRDSEGNVTGLPSVPIRVTLPAIRPAPKVGGNGARGEIKVRSGWHIEWTERVETTAGTSTWVDFEGVLETGVLRLAAPAENKVKITHASNTAFNSKNHINMANVDGRRIYYYAPATAKAPASNEGMIRWRPAWGYEELDDSFTFLAPKQQILPIQFPDQTIEAELGGRWRSVKSLSLSQIPAAGLPVRFAGSKRPAEDGRFIFPSTTRYLVWNDTTKNLSIRNNPA
jgi:hypothetical protein